MKRRLKLTFLVLLAAIIMIAASTAQNRPPKTDSVPPVTAEHQRDYFKASLAVTQAQDALKQAQQVLQGSMEAILKDCGEAYQPQLGPEGNPVCVAKPKAPTGPPAAPGLK